jgi:ABC-type glycerol-3-phosphate transport system permease component
VVVAARSTGQDIVYNTLSFLLVGVFFVGVLYPLYFTVIASVSSPYEVYLGNVVFFPRGFSLAGYKRIYEYRDIWVGYGNSLIYAALGTLGSVLVTLMAAYPLSRKDFRGRSAFMVYFVFSLYFGGGLIPTYLVVRSLGLLNTRAVMIVPSLIAVWNIIIARTFIRSNVPYELFESAEMDGCSHFTYFVKVLLPLSKALIAVLALFSFAGFWNAFFNALIYLRDRDLYPLQLVLRDILMAQATATAEAMFVDVKDEAERRALADLMKYGTIIVASAPLLIAYPFVQKHFVKGVLIGSLKG